MIVLFSHGANIVCSVVFQAPIWAKPGICLPCSYKEFGSGRVNYRFYELEWNQTNAVVVGCNWTKFLLKAPDTVTSRGMIYLQVYFENRCLMFDLLLFDQFFRNMLFCIIISIWLFCSIFWYLSYNFENTFFT